MAYSIRCIGLDNNGPRTHVVSDKSGYSLVKKLIQEDANKLTSIVDTVRCQVRCIIL